MDGTQQTYVQNYCGKKSFRQCIIADQEQRWKKNIKMHHMKTEFIKMD